MGSNNGGGGCETQAGTSVTSIDRYCGGTLNCINGQTNPMTVVSSRQPFELGVEFNAVDPATTANRGFCLNYFQIPC